MTVILPLEYSGYVEFIKRKSHVRMLNNLLYTLVMNIS